MSAQATIATAVRHTRSTMHHAVSPVRPIAECETGVCYLNLKEMKRRGKARTPAFPFMCASGIVSSRLESACGCEGDWAGALVYRLQGRILYGIYGIYMELRADLI